MKAVAYSVRSFEREFLAKANQKKHDITLITNSLSQETALYAEGKKAVIVFSNDDVSASIIEQLAGFGVKYIITRSTSTDHIDQVAAAKHSIKIANVPSYSPQAMAEHAVSLAFALKRHVIVADRHSPYFDFRNEELLGYTFSGKTVGLIGLGSMGLAAARIFNGLGCNVIAYDPLFPNGAKKVSKVTLADLFATSDIISLNLPLTVNTKYMINQNTLEQMKTGVMLINTSPAGLIDTNDVIAALDSGKIGYLDIDVYEHRHQLLFEDHEYENIKDALLEKLLQHVHVIVTPHQAYLTKEALKEIANQTIENLDELGVNLE
jgi:D-lactate dehydrogenase